MKKETILIIEDDTDIRELMATVLRDEGYAVRTARDGIEAFAALAENHEIDLITLDLLMPRMSGYEFLHDLADKHFEDLQHIPIIIVSAMTNARTVALQKGHRHIGKPFSADTLVDAVKEDLVIAQSKKEKSLPEV